MLRGIFGLLEAEGTRGRNNGQTIVIKNEGEHHKKKKELNDLEEIEANFPPCYVN